ncbi:MAG: signal peptide peptidase SppA [Deinococcota bacterium]
MASDSSMHQTSSTDTSSSTTTPSNTSPSDIASTASAKRLPERALPTLLHNAGVAVATLLAEAAPKPKPNVVITLSGDYPSYVTPTGRFSFLTEALSHTTSLESFRENCEQLAEAAWLETVTLRFSELSANLATLYAMRRALSTLTEAGKTVHAHLSTLSLGQLYLASVASSISMAESADVFLGGSKFVLSFYADALARLGVQFDKLAIAEYKNAGDSFARAAISDAQREQYTALQQGLEQHIVSTLAEARAHAKATVSEATVPETTLSEETVSEATVSEATVRGWLHDGLASAEVLLERGVIDQLAYDDEVIDSEHHKLSGIARVLPRKRLPFSKRVAVVSLEGVITTGKSQRSPLPLPGFGDTSAGSDTLVSTLRQVAEDDSTAAVVLYVNSGGGSALASDLIWRAVTQLDKPVVAVMGQVAASGGYYVLTHADHVMAAPVTVTGSIGVVIGKFVWQGFNERYGISTEVISDDPHATLFNSNFSFNDAEQALLTRSMEATYARFTRRVAEGRGLDIEAVNKIAKGRVWTGEAALEHGLIDSFGDVHSAILKAKELAGLPEGAAVYAATPAKTYHFAKANDAAATLAMIQRLGKQLSTAQTWLLDPNLLRLAHQPFSH